MMAGVSLAPWAGPGTMYFLIFGEQRILKVVLMTCTEQEGNGG